MRVILAGANPGIRLLDGDAVTAFASVWVVDWSERGAGTALVLWHDGRVRVLGEHPALAAWLERYFVRHFPEVAGLPWPEPEVERAAVRVELDLATGLVATAADVEVRLSGVLDRRVLDATDFPLDGEPHTLTLLFAPVAEGRITVGGLALPGTVTVDGPPERPSSSAFLTTAEVWRR